MAGTAGDIRYTQVEQRGFRFGSFEALGNQVVERVLDEWLNEIVWCVVGTRSCSFVALCEAELDGVAVVDKDGLVFEQAFVNGAELLHVERSVVHADELVVLRVLVDIEGTQAAEQHIIAQRAGASSGIAWLPKRSPASGEMPSFSPGPSASKSRKVDSSASHMSCRR
jgi:hypothetical protein